MLDCSGRREAGLVGLVEGFEVGIRRVNAVAQRGRVEALELHFAALQQRLDRGGDAGRGGQRGVGDATQYLLHGQVLAQLRGENFGAHALRLQQFAVDAAVGVAQAGELRVVGEQSLQALVGGRQVLVARGGQQHTLADQQVERLAPRLRRVHQLGVEFGRTLAQPLDIALVRLVPFGAGDGLPVDLGHGGIAAFGEAAVAVDAEER